MKQIVLIPKISRLETVNHFRSISLCNFLYKVISKIIANRMKPFVPKLVRENQRAFVSGRQIQDNVLIAHEAFHHLNTEEGKEVRDGIESGYE